MNRLLLLALIFLPYCIAPNAWGASERTNVLRHPNGTSGSITSVSVTVTFYEYTSDGKRIGSRKMTWTETTSGTLSGNRTGYTSSYPITSWSTGSNITSTFSAWTTLFNTSCAVEDPNNYGGNGVSGWSPLTGISWTFAPPNDTSNWLWYTGHSTDPEHPDTWPDAYTPTTTNDYWPVVPSSDTIGTFTGTVTDTISWAGSSASVVPTHCRSVKAFIRVDASDATYRRVTCVWDEVINDESVQRYLLNFIVRKDGGPWYEAAAPSVTYVNGSGSAATVFGQTVSVAGGTRVGSSFTFTALADYQKPVNSGSGTFYNYRSAITRFLNAYTRDHGTQTSDVVYDALRNSASLAYYPNQPTGALTYDYVTDAGSLKVPMFDRCDGATTGGEAPGSGNSSTTIDFGTYSGTGTGHYSGNGNGDSLNHDSIQSHLDALHTAWNDIGLGLSATTRDATDYVTTIHIPIGGTLSDLTYWDFEFHLNPDNMPSSQAAAQTVLQTIRTFVLWFATALMAWIFFWKVKEKVYEV